MQAAQKSSGRLQLLDLPNEIIAHIFACLDTPSPFQEAIILQPNHLAVRSPSIALKQVSLLSRRLRKLALPPLFKHILVNPSHLKTILSFLTTNSLDVQVKTVVAYLPSPCSHYHPPWWFQLLSRLTKLTTLSIIAPPHIFSEVMETNARSRDIWAFNMPYQILQLECQASDLTLNPPPSTHPAPSGDHILSARPWTTALVNEGSSLKAYTTWEYWLRNTPSPVTALTGPARTTAFVSHLRHFSLVSIFPIYGHVERCLRLIKQMHRLRSLFLKLIPEPSSTVLSDEIDEAKGHLDVNDPWNEHDTSLALAADACLYLSERDPEKTNDCGLPRLGELRELTVDDVKMLGVRANIEHIVTTRLDEKPNFNWGYAGNGVWRRDPALRQWTTVRSC